MAGKYHVRSVSFPSRLHPSTTAVEQELKKLRTWEASCTSTSGSICAGLSGLEDLNRCAGDLLNMASTHQVLSQNHKYVDGLLDGSVRILDTCSIARDLVSQTKEHVRTLQSAVRRRKGDSSVQEMISDHACFKKKMRKETKRLIAALKQINNKNLEVVDHDSHLFAVIGVLREVNVMNISVFQSLLSFLSAPVSKPRLSKWSLVSKLMHKGTVACEEKELNANKIETLDFLLGSYASCVEEADAEKKQRTHRSLEALEISIEGFESGLGSAFRSLIRTRASLLNIISQ